MKLLEEREKRCSCGEWITVRHLSNKPCMVLKGKTCIFMKIPENFDIKNFQQKDCIFLGGKIATKIHWLVDLLLSAFLPVCLTLPLESVSL